VIGDEVEDQVDLALLERVTQAAKGFVAAEFGIEPVMVDNVVAMRAARARF
jgi:hypothetical protein